MVEIPEKKRTEALTELAQISAERDAAQAEVDRIMEKLRAASVRAAKTGASRSRVRELAKVSSRTLYGWLNEAGLEVRAKRPATKKAA
ncbi:hypothetical protein AB0N09_42620 [Streptomyces erythrochromogenes]|uniref:hypothetical protein n=1 Tax=Streptomyces erythrochromogenes TaxID=285574 RepID=UPI00342FBC53